MNTNEENFNWEHQEGQLAVDVVETPDTIIIRSAIAGVKPQDLDIHITHDLITIRGERKTENKRHDETIHFQECFWGRFSRSIILPVNVRPEEADAVIKNGILTITIPKAQSETDIKPREQNS
ncbi:Hsp20/alpha crystallin family protein [Candidatus Parcubacteria bacterium]|nr:MAG: Hsp20/alpha crystallin family protein [Candidatus Parcubacteria bacterium]